MNGAIEMTWQTVSGTVASIQEYLEICDSPQLNDWIFLTITCEKTAHCPDQLLLQNEMP